MVMVGILVHVVVLWEMSSNMIRCCPVFLLSCRSLCQEHVVIAAMHFAVGVKACRGRENQELGAILIVNA